MDLIIPIMDVTIAGNVTLRPIRKNQLTKSGGRPIQEIGKLIRPMDQKNQIPVTKNRHLNVRVNLQKSASHALQPKSLHLLYRQVVHQEIRAQDQHEAVEQVSVALEDPPNQAQVEDRGQVPVAVVVQVPAAQANREGVNVYYLSNHLIDKRGGIK